MVYSCDDYKSKDKFIVSLQILDIDRYEDDSKKLIEMFDQVKGIVESFFPIKGVLKPVTDAAIKMANKIYYLLEKNDIILDYKIGFVSENPSSEDVLLSMVPMSFSQIPLNLTPYLVLN